MLECLSKIICDIVPQNRNREDFKRDSQLGIITYLLLATSLITASASVLEINAYGNVSTYSPIGIFAVVLFGGGLIVMFYVLFKKLVLDNA